MNYDLCKSDTTVFYIENSVTKSSAEVSPSVD